MKKIILVAFGLLASAHTFAAASAETQMERLSKQIKALFEAAEKGDTAGFKKLMGEGAYPDSEMTYEGVEGVTPLMVAARFGNEELVAFLLGLPYYQKVNIYRTDKEGKNALMWAAIGGGRGALASTWHYLHGKNTLNVAKLLLENVRNTSKENIDLMSFLNRTSSSGNTALMSAASTGQEDLVKLLLLHGANAEAKNKSGETAADLARKAGNKNIAELIETSSKEKTKVEKTKVAQQMTAQESKD